MRKNSENIISNKMLNKYVEYLVTEEKSKATCQKYRHDITKFILFAQGKKITKECTLAYKEYLKQKYEPTSVNSMLAALNGFLDYCGMSYCKVKRLRIQKNAFCDGNKELTKEEYKRLVAASQKQGQERLGLIIQTICSTGIRVSELQYITVEAVERGKAIVDCKGKIRTVFIGKDLRKMLIKYIQVQHIESGSVFITRSGKPIHRSNIWKYMKALCDAANVSAEKVFPHNLRHLFARAFYGIEKDIAKLADILGHSSVETTRGYIISSGNEHRRQVERLGLII